MNATEAADKINAMYFDTISAYADDSTLVILAHQPGRARLEIGSVTLSGAAIHAWRSVVETLDQEM